MKQIFYFVGISVCALISTISFAQDPTPLYGGYVRWSGDGATLDEIDTTGGAFTVVGSVGLSSDFGTVNGLYGIAMDPTDEQMYCVYQSGGSGSRRLGFLDPESGAITDIGNSGNILDIDFGPDGTLYGTTGSFHGSQEFMEINKATGSTTGLFIHVNDTWGSGTIGYDPFADEMIHVNRSGGFSTIDLGALTETDFDDATGAPSEIQAFVVIDANTAWAWSWGTRYQVNLNTRAYSNLGGTGTYHAMGFGPVPCNPITVDAPITEACEGDPFTLTGTGLGTITWDGGIDNGVPFVPGPPGVYSYTPSSDNPDDCLFEEPINITVVGLPTVIAGAGDLNFCDGESVVLSASGDAHSYEWNDGAPLDLNPPVGEHTYTLVGEYTEGGCIGGMSSDEVTITVHALPIVSATADANLICLGHEVTLNGGGAETYEWDWGVVDGDAFEPTSVGTTTYTVIGTDENECQNSASVDVEVAEPITLAGSLTDEIEGGDGAIDITVTGGAPTYTFDWDNDGTGDFDDDEDLTGLTGGTYTVIVTGAAGCETTETFTIGSQLSITEDGSIAVSIYPNPTVEDITIEVQGTFQYELVGINGSILVVGTSTDIETVSLDEFASGVYFITVKTEAGSTTQKVVKK